MSTDTDGIFSTWRHDHWILPFFRTFRVPLLIALGLGLLGFICSVGMMFTSGYLISAAAAMPISIMALRVAIGLVQIFGIGDPVTRYFERLFSHDWILRVTSKLRLKLYRAIDRSTTPLHHAYRSGDVLALLAEDIGHIQNLFLRTIFPTVIAWVLALIVLVALGILSLPLAGIWLLLLAIIVVLIPLISILVDGARRMRVKAMRDDLYTELTDDVLGVNDWVCAQRGSEYVAHHSEMQNEIYASERKLGSFARWRGIILQVLFAAMVLALLIWTAVAFGGEAATSPASAVNWIAAFILAFFPLIEAFSPVSAAVEEASAHTDTARRLNELPTDEGEDDAAEDEQATVRPDGTAIDVDDVSFAYAEDDRPVLGGLSLQIEPGEKLAVLGRSGAGKSTLVSLIRGDLTPQKGTVTLGSVPTDTFGDGIARYISVIGQETHLFNTTLFDNIALAKPEASDEEVWEVVDKVGLHDLIASLPEQLDTQIGDAGLRFSGGERRRIALARVLLQDTPVVILDEPTVGLDPATEAALLQTFFETLAGRTIIMVTHHLQGVEQMDRVVFIEDGHVAIEGTPQTLEEQNERYRRLLAFDRGTERLDGAA
ncbi:MAG: thiol reductant ABC exporter subunit CydC [Coriobacteriaceae bacterium]|nr:thiol reductant ABC exporter subunit CydC [Coriobacteriaceae bacterium]